MLRTIDCAQMLVCDCGLACCDDGGRQAAADGCSELLDGVEDGVAVGLLLLAQPVQAVGHDVAEAQPDAQHEENIEYQDGHGCQPTGCKGKAQEADQGNKAAADDGDARARLIVEPAGELSQNGSDRRARQHYQTPPDGGCYQTAEGRADSWSDGCNQGAYAYHGADALCRDLLEVDVEHQWQGDAGAQPLYGPAQRQERGRSEPARQ